MATPIVQQVDFIKNVRFNRQNKDWDAFVTIVATGETIYIGSGTWSWDAEQLCNAYVFNQLVHALPAEEATPEPDPTPTPTPAVAPMTSELFCCRRCSSDVALIVEAGSSLVYACINPKCAWHCDVDCPQLLGVRLQVLFDAKERVAQLADFDRFRPSWDAYATMLATEQASTSIRAGRNQHSGRKAA